MRVSSLIRVAAWLAVFSGCAWVRGPVPGTATGADAGASSARAPAPAVTTAPGGEVDTRPVLAVLPFKDDSGFRQGVWDLGAEMAELLRVELAAGGQWRVLPRESLGERGRRRGTVSLQEAADRGRQVQADLVLVGRIQTYGLHRFSVGDPMLGGYKAYEAKAELVVDAVWAGTALPAAALVTKQEQTNRGVGVDLLGKPRPADVEFEQIRKMTFGSPEFRATLLGQVTLAAVADLLAQLDQAVQGRARASGQQGEVLSVEGTEVFLSVGSDSGTFAGQRYWVEPQGAASPAASGDATVGGGDSARPETVVEVVEVVGGRLSRGQIVAGSGVVHPGDSVRPAPTTSPAAAPTKPVPTR